jgi:type III pantothenate kinase
MISLYFDIGNTSLKVFNPLEEKLYSFDTLSDDWLKPVCSFLNGKLFDRILIASVTNQKLLDELFSILNPNNVERVSCHYGQWMIQHCYHRPERLGIDRLLAMEAAYRMVKDKVVVIDCGSAVTVDVVARSGDHLGGYIVPGYRLQMKSLTTDTNLTFENVEPKMDLGMDTSSCIKNGSLKMIHAFCQSIISDVKPEKVFVTGGDLKGDLSSIKEFGIFDELLVFKGMKYVYG